MTFWTRALDIILRGFFQLGQLEVTRPDGTTVTYGDGSGDPVRIALKSEAVQKAIVLNADMGLGEGYVSQNLVIENDDLEGLFKLALHNREMGSGGIFRAVRHLLGIKRRLLLRNPVGKAQRNVAHHYDLSEALYDLFLDADRQYSCAYFADPQATLDEAQVAKKRHIAAKLNLSPGQHVLDIGCGWGGMALTLAQEFDMRVTGVTLSAEQHAYARARVEAAGLQDRIDIRLQDYRLVEGQFDRVVSVGMFEHVGPRNYGEFFRTLDKLLTEDGVALIHTIAGTGPPRVTSPWITKYIFPGGHIPVMSEIAPHFERTGLKIADIEVWRLHYAETLKAWHDRFMARADEAEALYDAEFVRMWRYYLKASEMTFRYGRQVVFQMQFSRQLGTIPLTRDYLYT